MKKGPYVHKAHEYIAGVSMRKLHNSLIRFYISLLRLFYQLHDYVRTARGLLVVYQDLARYICIGSHIVRDTKTSQSSMYCV